MKRKYMTENSSKGVASSSNAVQQRGEEVYDDEPSGDTEVLDHITNQIDLNDTLFPIDPPLPANCGRPYKWQEIFDGTQNFSETLHLGRGNFGEVYRCHFSNTNEDAAVKIQDPTNPSTGHDEFLAEVRTLHAADHKNVIRLLGRCYGLKNRALVYEFMPNGSLDRHIFVNKRRGLDWSRRLTIAAGVAQGLLYVHHTLKMIHGDVKAENILLDADFLAKLTGFRSATEITIDQDGNEQEHEIYPVKGTQGWIAPETEKDRLVSTKSDVYSYGVFLFVLFTGRKPLNLIDWVMRIWTKKYAPVDVELGNKYSVEGLHKIYYTARMCINPKPHERPAIAHVERMVLQAAAFPVQKVERRQSA